MRQGTLFVRGVVTTPSLGWTRFKYNALMYKPVTTPQASMIPIVAFMIIVINIAVTTMNPPAMMTARLPNIVARTLLIGPVRNQ